jgi:hypothetical protein
VPFPLFTVGVDVAVDVDEERRVSLIGHVHDHVHVRIGLLHPLTRRPLPHVRAASLVRGEVPS